MYYSKIEPAITDEAATRLAVEVVPDARSVVLGLGILLVGLPLLAARVFLAALARDLARVGKVAGIVGQSFVEALRNR